MKREQWGETSHQKLYQIKMAISRWVQMNISFSSKFNLSPDSERKQRRSLLVEVRGSGSSRGEYEQRLVEVTEELDAGRGFLWCVIPLSVREALRLREGGIRRFVFTCATAQPPASARPNTGGINALQKETAEVYFSASPTSQAPWPRRTRKDAQLQRKAIPPSTTFFPSICLVSVGLLYTIQFHSLCQHTRGSSLASISLMRNGRCSFCRAEGPVSESAVFCSRLWCCFDILENNILLPQTNTWLVACGRLCFFYWRCNGSFLR